MQNFFPTKSLAFLLGVTLLASCAKETSDVSSSLNDKIPAEELARIEQIKGFHTTMTSLLENRTGRDSTEYTPDEFVTMSEEAINYTYSLPFDDYWDVESKTDSITMSISNCKILATDAPTKYQTILDKVACQFNCHNLSNKKLKFVKITVISKTCTEVVMTVSTTVGTTTTSASIGEPHPGSNIPSNFRRIFYNELFAIYGTCAVQTWGDPFTSTELTKKATYNLIGGTDLAHTLVDAETRSVGSYTTPNINWWYLNCFDPNGNSTCNSTDNCNLYFAQDGQGIIDFNTLTQLGYDEHCLTPTELNSILTSTESYSQGQASAANKLFINIRGEWSFSLCGNYNHFWYGDLTLGRKIYRMEQPQNLPTSNCNCQ